MNGPFDPSRVAAPAPESESWLPFAGGVLLGLFAWFPGVAALLCGGNLVWGTESGVYTGMMSLAVPGLVQLPVAALTWALLRSPGARRGLVIGAAIVAFLNASCWGLLFLSAG